MGTPDFSVPSLQRLMEDGHEIPLVVTQPDRPRGRGRKSKPSPIKEMAMALQIPVIQPEKISETRAIAEIADARPRVIVVIAFGQILCREVLSIPELGCINAHASLLPRHRGAAPIQWAILTGDRVTGVTTMMMDEGLDTGDMLYQRQEPIRDDDTAGTLHDRLASVSAELVSQTVEVLDQGAIKPVPQDPAKATYAPQLAKKHGKIDFAEDADTIARKIRAFNPWPGAYAFIGGEQTRVTRAKPETGPQESPGKILSAGRDGIVVACGSGVLRVLELRPPGKRSMEAGAFLAGRKLVPGDMIE